MNYNQKLLKESLDKGLKDADFTYNKYRELLDVCLAALEEPAQVSEPTQTGLKKGMYDEMHEYPSGPMYTIKLKDNAKSKSLVDKLFKIWDKEKSNLAFEPVLPVRGHVCPDAGRIEIEPTEEAAKKILEDSGYTVTKNSEPEKQLDKMYKHKTNVFSKDPTVQGEIKFERLDGATFIREAEEKDEYAAAIEEWQASFEKWKESQTLSFERMNEIADKVNKIYADVKHALHPLVKRIDTDTHIIKSGLGLKGVKPGEYKQANINKDRKTLDNYPLTDRQLQQVTEHVKKNLKETNTTVQFTGGQLTEEQANEFLEKVKNDLAKSIREERLKGRVW